jgi:hypothetical protein
MPANRECVIRVVRRCSFYWRLLTLRRNLEMFCSAARKGFAESGSVISVFIIVAVN